MKSPKPQTRGGTGRRDIIGYLWKREILFCSSQGGFSKDVEVEIPHGLVREAELDEPIPTYFRFPDAQRFQP
jgi:hypothetical protein